MRVVRDGARGEERFVLQLAGRMPAVQIFLGGHAQDLAQLEGVVAGPFLLHLHPHQLAGEAHHPHVVPGGGINDHGIAGVQGELLGVPVEALAGVLEADLHRVEELLAGSQRNAGEPAIDRQLVAASRGAMAMALAARGRAALGGGTGGAGHGFRG